jgi:hypothetical protein
MPAELVKTIDDALTLVRAHPDEMTRAEVDRLRELADRAYLLAAPLGLDRHFPQVSELRPELEGRPELPLPPPQFVTKLNLPGDWDYTAGYDSDALPMEWESEPPDVPDKVFLLSPTPRWFDDMARLRSLAEAAPADAKPDAVNVPAAVVVPETMPWEDDRGWGAPTSQVGRILRLMWKRAAMDWEAFAQEIWGRDNPNEGAVRTALSRVNTYLAGHGERRCLVKPRDESRICWG